MHKLGYVLSNYQHDEMPVIEGWIRFQGYMRQDRRITDCPICSRQGGVIYATPVPLVLGGRTFEQGF